MAFWVGPQMNWGTNVAWHLSGSGHLTSQKTMRLMMNDFV